MWPKAKVRPIRFHDLRHTTASLLMMAGANPAAVQRILRHTDPRITMEVYGHLAPGYLRDEVNRLRFAPSSAPADAPEVVSVAAVSNEFTAHLLPKGATRPFDRAGRLDEPREIAGISLARPAGLEPATRGLEVR
jgi:hypothetical protein